MISSHSYTYVEDYDIQLNEVRYVEIEISSSFIPFHIGICKPLPRRLAANRSGSRDPSCATYF